MAKRIGFGNYQYEVVENWPKVAIRGAVADVCVDARGRVYAGVRNPREDGSVSNILGGVGHVLVLDRDGHEVGSWGNLASSPHGIWVNPAGEIYLALGIVFSCTISCSPERLEFCFRSGLANLTCGECLIRQPKVIRFAP